ncbi:MAG: hypothetical protein WBL66_00750, partial [Candidatus Acidiferrales bacterium]
MLGSISRRIEDAPAIVVAEMRKTACLAERAKGLKHLDDRRVELGADAHLVYGGKCSRMQEKIEGVNVVVQRLLKVHTVVL